MFPKLHGLLQTGFPMYPQHIGFDAIGLPNVPQDTLAQGRNHAASSLLLCILGDVKMDVINNGVYFLKPELYKLIKDVGGICQDSKERPIVALVPSIMDSSILWAIPMGDLSHRTPEQLKRLEGFISSPSSQLRSCFYHIGNTDKRSIFFVSDVLPITNQYIDRAYVSHGRSLVIKNKKLIAELNRKVSRILSYEKNYLASKGKPFFRQNIYGIYNALKGQSAT